ncbi:MAG: hypothetical protein ASARMPREDX12_002105 [Alectoria sarmentosa]|nr:MAG: hypothetical protein ASARMPREDX12_002105 [Alectoria sarmentosa]
MPGATKSILEYLRSDSPVVTTVHYADDDKSKKTKSNTTNVGYKKPRCIRQWDDFDFDSLQAIYDGHLRGALAQEIGNFTDRSTIPHLPFCEIHDEDSFEALVIKWNQSVISHALDMTQNFSGADQADGKIYMVRGGQADRTAGICPDWAGIRRADIRPANPQTSRPSNILPGDTKVGWKWSSHSIVAGDTEDVYLVDDWLEPIKQIFTYCCKLKARYGYIITDKELVVTRIRPFSQDDLKSPVESQGSVRSFPSPKERLTPASSELSNSSPRNAASDILRHGTLEYKAIPWSSNDSEASASETSLTINLALWWLHMMALESHEICYWYPPLAEAMRRQTSGGQHHDVKGLNLAPDVLRPTHAGTKRRKDEASEGDDGSHARPSPRRMAMRSTRSQAKRQRTDQTVSSHIVSD